MDTPIDWSLWHAFLAVAEAGSLSAAARKERLSQPTLGRQVRALETALGVTLFTRTAQGLTPTEAGADLLDHARDMRAAATRAELAAAGREAQPTGTVRITASRIVSMYLLPPVLAALRRAEPGIEIELAPSDTTENLLFHEADIAVRMYRPTQPDVIVRHLGDLGMGLYAATDLLDRHQAPQSLDDLLALPFVGFDRDPRILDLMARLGQPRRRGDFAVRCDDQVVYWSLIRAGCGVGGMQTAIGDADPAVRRIAPFVALPPLPVWLATPEALGRNARLRRVWDHLAQHLGAICRNAPPPAAA